MRNEIVPSVTLEHCPRCAGFLVEDVLFDGQGWIMNDRREYQIRIVDDFGEEEVFHFHDI